MFIAGNEYCSILRTYQIKWKNPKKKLYETLFLFTLVSFQEKY